jgi:hypothetical protein
MAVGRSHEGGAMMGLTLDEGLSDDLAEQLAALDGVLAARYIDLGA